MNDQKATLVITAVVNKENLAEVPSYLQQIQSVFTKNGAKPMGRYKTVQKIAGPNNPEIVTIFEFENAQVIDTLIKSEDFTALAGLRSRVFDELNLMISVSQ